MKTINIHVELLPTTDSYFMSDKGELELVKNFPKAISYGQNLKTMFNGKTCWLPDYIKTGYAESTKVKINPVPYN